MPSKVSPRWSSNSPRCNAWKPCSPTAFSRNTSKLCSCSIQPKYQQAVLLLGTVCSQPQDSKVQQYIDEAQRVIRHIEALQPTKATDRSDLATLYGFYYTALIVTNPQQNGPRYYRQALDNFDEALKLNPKNAMAQMLLARFKEGMNSSK